MQCSRQSIIFLDQIILSSRPVGGRVPQCPQELSFPRGVYTHADLKMHGYRVFSLILSKQERDKHQSKTNAHEFQEHVGDSGLSLMNILRCYSTKYGCEWVASTPRSTFQMVDLGVFLVDPDISLLFFFMFVMIYPCLQALGCEVCLPSWQSLPGRETKSQVCASLSLKQHEFSRELA